MVKSFLKNCFIYKIAQGKPAIYPETPKLPEFRASCNHPFENAGVDYAGPLYFTETADHCVQTAKCYVLLVTYTRRRSAFLNFSRANIYFKEQNTQIVVNSVTTLKVSS